LHSAQIATRWLMDGLHKSKGKHRSHSSE
jgi:hypothetical protein